MPLTSGRWNDNISAEWFGLSTSCLISNGNKKILRWYYFMDSLHITHHNSCCVSVF